MEISGDKTIELAKSAEKVSNNLGVEIVVAPPQPSLWTVTNNIEIPVICQHVDDAESGFSDWLLYTRNCQVVWQRRVFDKS